VATRWHSNDEAAPDQGNRNSSSYVKRRRRGIVEATDKA